MITININGLTLCHKGSGGVTHNTLPDVCKTPPLAIPIPFENEAYSSDLIKGTSSVFADGGNMIANYGSCFAKSVFDEPGSMGGVKSGTNRAEAEWISHSFDVFFEGKPACRLTDKMFMNHRNTVNMAGLCQATLPEMNVESCLDGNNSAFDNNTEPKAANNSSDENQSADNKAASNNASGEDEQTEDNDKPRPMPCIVILIHGVNDIGEAYQNQEEGIIKGLKKRLERSDLSAHEWNNYLAIHNKNAHKNSWAPGRSPVIPFYWGYKPVTHDDYVADQQRYRKEVDDLNEEQKGEAKIPYDTYQENDPKKMANLGNDGHNRVKFQNDSFKNALDTQFAKNGGTFANATTNIPDMLGPGSGGAVIAAAGFATLYMNGGDYTHPIYANPHRIYQFFAAQRLADLILQIRNNQPTSDDVINIVAHSQGTIITMLANMLVKQAGQKPANCAIFNHSPYSLENRFSENLQEGHHQTDEARQNTFKNFCKLMAVQYKGGQHTEDEIKAFEDIYLLESADRNKWHSDQRFSRNNNGKVYNYFCPVDGTVSLKNIQGFGWRGIPQSIAKEIPNLYQRVFYQHGVIGKAPDGAPFVLPMANKGDFITSKMTCATYCYCDVIINGEALPETFTYKLQGQDNHPPYETRVDPNSPDQEISYSAKAGVISRTVTETFPIISRMPYSWTPGHILTKEELVIESRERKKDVSKGVVSGTKGHMDLQLTWFKTREELEEEWKKTELVGYSQHSSIVMSEFSPSHAMAFDLAIGQCKAFDYQGGKFWEELLQRADWRDPMNGNIFAKEYYSTGKLSEQDTKRYMNKPDEVLPKDVENQYFGGKTKTIPAKYPDIHNTEVPNLQWDMPKPLEDEEFKNHGDNK